ncbi:MAG: Wzz/FepE/Etk N-terminal domain-containing protein [Solirubrobacteraceae bacterium]
MFENLQEVTPPTPAASASPAVAPAFREPTPSERLRQYAGRLRRRWLLLVLVTLLTTAAAAAYSFSQPKQYDATATLYFPQTSPLSTALGIPTSQPADTEREANTNVALVTSPSVAAAVVAQLKLSLPIQSVLQHVQAAVSSNSDLVAVTATQSSAAAAANLANAFAKEYVNFRRSSVQAAIDQAITQASRSLTSLPRKQQGGSEAAALSARLRQLQTARDLQTGPAQLLQAAAVPNQPSSPHPKKTTALGFGLGLLLAVAIALALDLLDRRLKDEDEIVATLRSPVLAAFPSRRRGDRAARLTARQRRAAELLASYLRLKGRDTGEVILSAIDGEDGQAQVALGLAAALCHAGRRVVVLQVGPEGKLLDKVLGFVDRPGLAAALSDPSMLESMTIPVAAEKLVPSNGMTTAKTFDVLPIGYASTEYQDLAGPSMRKLRAYSRTVADVVVVVVASLEDAMAFLDESSTPLLVVRRNGTTRDAAGTAVATLHNAHVRPQGLVVTNAVQ